MDYIVCQEHISLMPVNTDIEHWNNGLVPKTLKLYEHGLCCMQTTNEILLSILPLLQKCILPSHVLYECGLSMVLCLKPKNYMNGYKLTFYPLLKCILSKSRYMNVFSIAF